MIRSGGVFDLVIIIIIIIISCSSIKIFIVEMSKRFEIKLKKSLGRLKKNNEIKYFQYIFLLYYQNFCF